MADLFHRTRITLALCMFSFFHKILFKYHQGVKQAQHFVGPDLGPHCLQRL